MLAAVPDKPSAVPLLNLDQTTTTQLHVDYAAFLDANNGGSMILSYELSIYDTNVQAWKSVTGGYGETRGTNLPTTVLNPNLLVTHIIKDDIVKGITYTLRYRAWNVNGPGEWSENGYILAA